MNYVDWEYYNLIMTNIRILRIVISSASAGTARKKF